MFTKIRGWKVMVLTLLAIALLGLPVAAGAADVANGITSPKDGATVSGSVDVKGYAADPNFMKWQLDLLPGGVADAATFLAVGETSGEFTYTLDTTPYPNGEHALRLRVVTTDGNYKEYINKVTFANAAAKPAAAVTAETKAAEKAETPAVAAAETKAAAAPTPAVAPKAIPNGITSPKEGAKVSGSVDVKGYAADPNFMKWQLDILPGLDAVQAIFVAVGETPGEFSYALDTTAYPDGNHALRLRVVRTDGNYDEYITKFTIANAAAKPAAAKPAAAVTTETKAAETAEAPAVAAAETKPAPTPAPAVAPKAIPNGITSPKEGAKVSGAVEVKGNASDPNFAKWQLDVLAGGDANAASFLAAGETPGEFTSILDTTAYPNGEHALRLRVVRTDGNYDEYITKFTIANAAAKAQAFAAGKYLRQGTQDRALQFNKDGTFAALLLPDTTLAKATYSVKGDVYTETSNDQGCISNRHYKYTFDGTKLVFTPQEAYDPATDSCAGRAADFNPDVTWVMFK